METAEKKKAEGRTTVNGRLAAEAGLTAGRRRPEEGRRAAETKWPAERMTAMGLMAALLCASSYIVIPLPFTAVSITAQTMVVNLIGMILGPADTAAVFLVWILLGAAGAPVFSGGSGGVGILLGPGGGYIAGFFAAAPLGEGNRKADGISHRGGNSGDLPVRRSLDEDFTGTFPAGGDGPGGAAIYPAGCGQMSGSSRAGENAAEGDLTPVLRESRPDECPFP